MPCEPHYLNLFMNMSACSLRDGLKHVLNISRLGNIYIQATKPWELVKQGPDSW